MPYIFEADLLLRDPGLITRYQYASNFLGIPVEQPEDWCFVVKDGVIRDWRLMHKGDALPVDEGVRYYQEIGISYWNAADGKKLEDHLRMAYDLPGGHDIFWDHVPLIDFADEYQVRVRSCIPADVTEIDTFRELQALDKAYDV